MGCRILYSPDDNKACLYCSTTDTVFGPLFKGEGFDDAEQEAEAFCWWIEDYATRNDIPLYTELQRASDPRSYSTGQLSALYSIFRRERAAVKA